MTTDQVFKIILYAVAKNKSQGYVSPDDFNNTLMPMAQASYLDYLLGEYQKYKIQRPIAVVEIGQNERVRESLAPLIYGTVLFPFVYNGISAPPNDFEYVDSMWTQYGYYNIRFVDQNRLTSNYRSSIDQPTVTNPIYLINHEGFQFFPIQLGAAKMSYVRKPPPIVWAYTTDGNGRPSYDTINSQQPVWGETDIFEIIVRALALVGVNLQIGIVIGYANEIKNNGQ